MSGIIITCADCGASYEVGKEEISRGIAYWSRCPDCRPSDESEDTAA